MSGRQYTTAYRGSTDIELDPLPSSEPVPGPSIPSTSKSSTFSLPLVDAAAAIQTSQSSQDLNHTDPSNIQSLHPVDRGLNAWLFLLGATVIETLVWGIPFSIGVLHLYWTTELFPGYGAGTITLAATMQAGLAYVFTSLFGPIITIIPRYTRIIQAVGAVISAIGVVAAAFATEPWHLVVTFGLLYPFAAATYLPCATILFEWFSARRGLAAGIMFAGTGIGGTIFPFILSGLITRLGYKPAMISIGIIYGALLLIALIPIKRRIPLPRRRAVAGDEGVRRPRPNMEFTKHRLVYVGCLITMFASLGSFIPTLWLPAFADDLHVYPSGTGLIAIMNAASITGNGLMGYLSDRFPIRSVLMLNCLCTALSCFFLWGFGTNAGLLIPFVLAFGVFGLGFSSLTIKMISAIARDDPSVPALLFSLLAFCKGVGNMASGPIADQLLKVDILRGGPGGYGVNNYGILLIFTGGMILLAGGVAWFFSEPRKGEAPLVSS